MTVGNMTVSTGTGGKPMMHNDTSDSLLTRKMLVRLCLAKVSKQKIRLHSPQMISKNILNRAMRFKVCCSVAFAWFERTPGFGQERTF